MKKKLIGLNYKGKKRNVEVYSVPFWMRWKGLMFQHREKARALIFEFKRPVRMAIHSFFVFFPFLAIWLDDKDKIIDSKVIKPFRFSILPSKKFVKLIEIPINKNYDFF